MDVTKVTPKDTDERFGEESEHLSNDDMDMSPYFIHDQETEKVGGAFPFK